MKRVFSIFLICAMILCLFPQGTRVYAAKDLGYRETSKANVPLRKKVGADETIVSYITNKGTAFKVLEKYNNWVNPFKCNVWYKVEITADENSNGLSGNDFWLWDGNTTEHTHKYNGMACTKSGCDYAKGIKNEWGCNENKTVVANPAYVRSVPYEVGKVLYTIPYGQSVTVEKEIENGYSKTWYQIRGGGYIYSERLGATSLKKEDVAAQNYYSTDPADRPSYFQPYAPALAECKHEHWSVGVCKGCGKKWVLKLQAAQGTYKAASDTFVRDIPYREGKSVGVTYKKGEVVPVTAKAENSAGNMWYKTKDGWIYSVANSSLNSAKLATASYTFRKAGETYTPKVILQPADADVDISWKVSDKSIAVIDEKTGKISPVAKGKAVAYATVKSQEGKIITLSFNITVDKSVSYETWSYDNYSYNSKLARECAEFSALAYPEVDYTGNVNSITFTDVSKKNSPNGLVRLLMNKDFAYTVSPNYANSTEENAMFVIASKKVMYNGNPKDLVYVIVRGSGTLQGWKGNMQLTGKSYNNMDYHYTFQKAKIDLNTQLNSYIREKGIEKPLLVITGHSRGAAVGNILAAELTGSTAYEKVYAYLFATPNVTMGAVKSNSNIINICNTQDFVTYMPFTQNWGYRKHGVIYSFDSKSALKTSPDFKSLVSKYKCNNYNWSVKTPSGASSYIVGKWKDVEEYYTHDPNTYGAGLLVCDTEAFDYFYHGMAPAAAGDYGGMAIIASHLPCPDGCPFKLLSNFLKDDKGAFADSHIIQTYYAAVVAGLPSYGRSGVSGFSLNALAGTSQVNEDEMDALYSFFTQDENALMLETYGWDIENPSTWSGVEWNENGNIVSIDLSYLNLSGSFNANNFPELQSLNIDGNRISMLGLTRCENLVELSCMSNNLSAISVSSCTNLQNLDCSFNSIGSLDVSEMSQLADLNCYGNDMGSLVLNGATALETVRCGSNQLSTIDISTNTALNSFYCANNNIIESQNASLLNGISAINEKGGSAQLGTQNYNENYSFNEAELSSLTEFANSALNLEKLGWDLEKPYTWEGVEWKIRNGEYHITSVELDGLELEGVLSLPEAEYVESVSCSDSALTSLNLMGCSGLSTLDCNNSGISELLIDECSSLQSLNCDGNSLEVAAVESSLNQIGLNTGIATYENQNIEEERASFNAAEVDALTDFFFTGDNVENLGWDLDKPGTWNGIVWTDADGEYRVNKIDMMGIAVKGALDLSGFDYLEDFNFGGTMIESVILPECIAQIPDNAFYNSGIEKIYLNEGLANIGRNAFAYCDNLRVVVIPKTVSRIFDGAFMNCSNLGCVVFASDEPFEAGDGIFAGASAEFTLIYFADTSWSAESALLSEYNYHVSENDYVVIHDSGLELKQDDYYTETNAYAGDCVEVIVAVKDTGKKAMCMLSVYKENASMDSCAMQKTELGRYMNVLTFEDVAIQYVGEEYCEIKAFLWEDSDLMKPLAPSSGRILFKPMADESIN